MLRHMDTCIETDFRNWLLCHVSFKKAAPRDFSYFSVICSSQEAFSFSALSLAPVM